MRAALPLTVASYLRYTSDHPGTLPDDEQTGRRFTDAQPSGDLDYLYHLTLNEDQHGLRLRIHDLSTQQGPGGTGSRSRRSPRPASTPPPHAAAKRSRRGASGTRSPTTASPCRAENPTPGGNAPPGTANADRPPPWPPCAANLATQVHPATFDTPHPALQVAGVLVFAYIDRHGRLRVSVHLDETEPWLFAGDGTVPTRITVEDTDVFTG